MSTGIVVALGIDRFGSTAEQLTRAREEGPAAPSSFARPSGTLRPARCYLQRAEGRAPEHAGCRDVRVRRAAAAVPVTNTDPGAGCCATSERFDSGSVEWIPFDSPRNLVNPATNKRLKSAYLQGKIAGAGFEPATFGL